ncbi:AzlD domain-containing protein [Isobaculum melis]|uniref:Branched-chain amino acid transport protein n=1 Tax=Isobaculum melis TaxID=142588 RepID=A0A1H9PQN5_9LACT|nr:AzlD domain-containing protein [Isobaculum melis]SER50109.1 Branched-chain amino acid transport protein [Isobaculum melis]
MTKEQFYLIIGMAVVTYLPRMLPMLLLSNRQVSKNLTRWMEFIPVSIFSALICSDIFFWNGELSIQPLENMKLLPTVLVFFIAYKTKSLIWSIVFGVGGIILLQWLI